MVTTSDVLLTRMQCSAAAMQDKPLQNKGLWCCYRGSARQQGCHDCVVHMHSTTHASDNSIEGPTASKLNHQAVDAVALNHEQCWAGASLQQQVTHTGSYDRHNHRHCSCLSLHMTGQNKRMQSRIAGQQSCTRAYNAAAARH